MSRKSPTWEGVEEGVIAANPAPLRAAGWARALARGLPVLAVIYLTVASLLLLRLVERPFVGLRRPLSGRVVRLGARAVVALIGLRLQVEGQPLRGQGAQVANHCSWMDIFVLNACEAAFFVAKDDVARWPVVSGVARAVGTLFIKRDPREAKRQEAALGARLRAGHRLIFFPEGTSSDGARVLPFKPTLFAAFFAEDLRAEMLIQPVSLRYQSADGAAHGYGFWGGMDFAPHFLSVLGAARQGAVRVTFHPPLRVAEFASRKALAEAAETLVRAGFDAP